MYFTIAAALLLLATPAQTRQWQLVGGNERVRTYVDMGSIARSGDSATVKHLTTFHNPVQGAYAYEVKITYDCTARRFREFDGIIYDATGAVIRNDPGPPDGEDLDFPEGSLEERAQRYVCFGERGLGLIADPFEESAQEFDWNP